MTYGESPKLDRKARRFFGIGKILPERVKVAKTCIVLLREMCHKCDKSVKMGRIVASVDTEKTECRECVRLMYKRIYGTECESVWK